MLLDIFANKIEDHRHMDEMADLMQKLRTTAEASNTFDSSQHALIRNYIDNNNLDSLVHILDHRSAYGIFLDHYSANLLLDKMIQEKNYKFGARFATLIALQEDFDNPIATNMMLYTCYKFMNSIEEFDDLAVKPEEVVETKPKKKKEEIKVRVAYLRNPNFDDHFELKNSYHLLGKTFLYLADEVKPWNATLSNSLNLLGFALYEKFEKGIKFLAEAKAEPFFKETVEMVKLLAEKVDLEANENAKQFYEAVNALTSLKEDKVDELIEQAIKKAVSEQEASFIENQKKIYDQWIVERDEKLSQEIHRLQRIQRLLNVEKLQEDLVTEEQKLWFFENEDNLELAIDSKKTFYPKKWFGKKKVPRVIDENYVPPDVDKRRNVK